jgi:hypothetical protein
VNIMDYLVIDGQGGGIGRALVEGLRARYPDAEICAVGLNAVATTAMLRAGADEGATGEYPAVRLARKAQTILAPLGVALCGAMLGEVTPAVARAVAESDARKILVPLARCGVTLAGAALPTVAEAVADAVRLAGLDT